MEIPVTILISEELVHKSDMVHFILKELCNLKYPIKISSIFIPTVKLLFLGVRIPFSWLQFPILAKIEGITSETMLLLWSMKEKHNCDSKFKFYFDTLPEVFNTGRLFAVNLLLCACCYYVFHY